MKPRLSQIETQKKIKKILSDLGLVKISIKNLQDDKLCHMYRLASGQFKGVGGVIIDLSDRTTSLLVRAEFERRGLTAADEREAMLRRFDVYKKAKALGGIDNE